jgi:hypothetical protein
MVTPEVESPITTGATIINTIVDKYKSNPNPKPPSGKAVTGIPITRQPGFKRRETGRLLARVIGVEFDPDYLKATTLEKAIIAGIQVPPSYDRPGVRERYITQKYEGIMGSADYVGRRRQALESFEQNMDVPTAVCLAEAARRDPQFAVLRRRLRQMDEKRRVGGDQRDQFGQLMDFLKGGDTNARPPLPQQAEQGFAGIDDRPYLSPSDEQESGEPITARSQPPWSAEPQQGEQESQEPW